MAKTIGTFRTRALSELRGHHGERKRLESALAEVNASIREIEVTAPSVAEAYADDPTGSKALGEVFDGMADLVKIATGSP